MSIVAIEVGLGVNTVSEGDCKAIMKVFIKRQKRISQLSYAYLEFVQG